jgi:hypothetical protein
MDSSTGPTPITPGAASKSTLKQRALVACYLTAITIAMLGWLSAFGWAAAEVAKLLISWNIGSTAPTCMLRSQSFPKEQRLFAARSSSRLSTFWLFFGDSGTHTPPVNHQRKWLRPIQGCASQHYSQKDWPTWTGGHEKAAAAVSQRRLLFRHRDHQTVMTRATKHDRWKVMTRVRRNG